MFVFLIFLIGKNNFVLKQKPVTLGKSSKNKPKIAVK